ncbi:MAG: bifunctional nuclease family protein [Chloroflexi bacterium]|nr:bifunctional nuclease family protein [Chloroflexota bacterium]
MIEMSVRAVKRAGEDRLVAVLERDLDAEPARGRLLITISRPEAHVIFHELREEKTLPGQTYELMAQVVTQLQGKLTAVELVADEAGKPAARLRLERTDGRSTIPTRAGQALALAVHLKVPLLVAEGLLNGDKGRSEPPTESAASVAAGDTPPPGDAEAASTVVEVPEVFLRAFEE